MRELPEDLIKLVTDQKSFLRFVQSLANDWDKSERAESVSPSPPYAPSAFGWQNGSIGTYLDAAAACGEAQLENGNFEGETNPWRLAAEILLAGKYYE